MLPEIKQIIQKENCVESLSRQELIELVFDVYSEPNKARVRTLIEKANVSQLREIIRILSEQS